MNKTWQQIIRVDLHKTRDTKLNEMLVLKNKLDKLNSDICLIERQILCKHEMERKYSMACCGGLDVDVCKHCGVEYDY